MNQILTVIPAYNEAGNIKRAVEAVKAAGMDYVVVSDGSTDDTVKICQQNGYCYVALPVNLGLAGCFQTGMKYAAMHGYKYAVQFDGDGQHEASDIPKMAEEMEKTGCDILQGSRYLNQKMGTSAREIGSRLIRMSIRLTTGRTLTDPTCGIRMYSERMIRMFATNLNFGPEPDTISYLLKNGVHIEETPVTIHQRSSGESYLKPLNAAKYMIRMLISILLIQNFREKRG